MVLERIVLQKLLPQTQAFLDQNQYAYKSNRSTSDATLALLHHCYEHLEQTNSFVRILFIDFSSAFNTTQPHLMARKLLGYDVDHRLTLWIINFLVNRTQCVRFQAALSPHLETSTGAPQGTVLFWIELNWIEFAAMFHAKLSGSQIHHSGLVA